MGAILITGASSGFGLAFVRTYAQKYPDKTIFALDRHSLEWELPEPAEAAGVRVCVADITDETGINQFSKDLDDRGVALDLVVHCAGVRGLVNPELIKHSDDVQKAETLGVMDVETMRSAFDVNALGFFILVKALMPSLTRGVAAAAARPTSQISSEQMSNGMREQPVKVIVLGSRMGSIGHNANAGGSYAYRASKAALNAILKSLSIDVPEVMWTLVHPGRVETGLVPVKEEGALTVAESLSDMLPLIERLGVENSGQFMDRFGAIIPW